MIGKGTVFAEWPNGLPFPKREVGIEAILKMGATRLAQFELGPLTPACPYHPQP